MKKYLKRFISVLVIVAILATFYADTARASVTMVQSKGTNTPADPVTATFDSTPTEGNLLIAFIGERSGATGASISGSGWTQRIDLATDPTDTTFRKYLGVWTKVAGASEPTAITVTPTGGGNATILIAEFEDSGGGTYTFEDAVSAASSATVSSQTTGTTANLSNTPLVLLGALHIKTSQTADPSGTTWTNNLTTQASVNVADATNGMDLVLGFYEDATGGTKSSTASFTSTERGAQNSLIAFSVSGGGASETPVVGEDIIWFYED